MTNSEVHITFFTPNFNATGSELVLLNLLKYLPTEFKASLVSKYKGSLSTLLPERISYASIFPSASDKHLVFKIWRRLFGNRRFYNSLEKYQNSIWYINTILLPDVMEYAFKHRIRVILHVHEMAQMYRLLSEQQIQRLVTYPELIIANSNASRNVLRSHKSSSEIRICYPGLSVKAFVFNPQLYTSHRSRLGISNEFVWMMSGSFDDNKNPRLFVDLAALLKQQGLNFKFLWIGSEGPNTGISEKYIQYGKEQGVNDKLIWAVNTKNYFDYFNSADGFVLTSKLESFSLVTLEALQLGLPIVANNCIGVNEILGSEYGAIIDGENTQLMAEKMQEIMAYPNSRNLDKGQARAARFDIQHIKDHWIDLLKAQLQK